MRLYSSAIIVLASSLALGTAQQQPRNNAMNLRGGQGAGRTLLNTENMAISEGGGGYITTNVPELYDLDKASLLEKEIAARLNAGPSGDSTTVPRTVSTQDQLKAVEKEIIRKKMERDVIMFKEMQQAGKAYKEGAQVGTALTAADQQYLKQLERDILKLKWERDKLLAQNAREKQSQQTQV